MITHQITVHHRPIKNIIVSGKKEYPKFIGQQGTHEHREYILKRALHFNPFSNYDEVIFRKHKYLITEIYDDPHYVSWVGLSPKYIELMDKDQTYIYVNHGEIKKARK